MNIDGTSFLRARTDRSASEGELLLNLIKHVGMLAKQGREVNPPVSQAIRPCRKPDWRSGSPKPVDRAKERGRNWREPSWQADAPKFFSVFGVDSRG
jgi:hypothetical protein